MSLTDASGVPRKSKCVLFVGGPANGKTLMFCENEYRASFPGSVDIFFYEFERLLSEGRTYHIARLSSDSLTDCLEKIFAGFIESTKQSAT